MSGIFGLLQLFVLSVAALALAVALVTATVYPWLRPRLTRMGPARRARLLTALCVAPLCIALLQTGLLFVPGVLGALWPELDHCLSHTVAGHVHLCFAHPPGSAGAWLGWLVVLGVVVGFGHPLAKDLARTWRSASLIRQLVHTAQPVSGGLRIVQSPVPLAAATAVGAEVLVSSALVETLSPTLLDAVVAHERAHVRRRDPWRRVAAMLFSAGHLPGVRRTLLEDLELACEQASDEEAAQAVGNRLHVAQALLAVTRMAGACTMPVGATAFGASSIEARVASLLAAPAPEGRLLTEVAWLTAAAALAIAVAAPGHHLAEHLIELLAG
ncbi:MAG: M56 family metallopeptidase [Myxococcota bacterium]|jgi:Zn-dependent protease with chaperone function|nr:M56 family metallopeptidase [Myxococcota bacterium]